MLVGFKKVFLLFVINFCFLFSLHAQPSKSDSASVASTLKSLLAICKNVDFGDPKTTGLGMFYNAAQYIVYRGEDKQRAWKAFADYHKAEDKKGVDEICTRINRTVNQDSNYTIIKYFTEKESEGTWHVLMISYTLNGNEKKIAFAFLKLRNRFGLGDIDQ